MISLYGEIKSYIARIKTLLTKQLDNFESINEQEIKTIISYLLILGEDLVDKNNQDTQLLKM